MANKRISAAPQNRGLVTSVALFSVAVLAGVYWIMQRGEEIGTGPAALLPALDLQSDRAQGWSLPTMRSAGAPDAGSPPDQMLESYRRQGAVVGFAQAYRGDVLQVGNQYFRLVHVDEASGYRHCGPSAEKWPCGTTPQHAMAAKISGKQVACFNRGYNIRNEMLGQCFLNGLDLGGWLIEQGMGFTAANRTDYRYKQAVAQRERRGYWHSR
jgi:endonuclease YncB( thermonuclease family)